jgi:GT2 family glycosyltransferase
MDISIIILNYKSKGFTMACLKSIMEADFSNLKYEIIVVDNDSDDSIGEILAWQYPQVVFIQNDKNIGMGAGNNVGIKKANGKYVAIMNPDTIAFRDTFIKLYEYMEVNLEVGVVGPLQLNPDKSIQNSCYRWHSLLTPLYRRTFLSKFSFAKKDIDRLLMKDYDHKLTREVDWLLGSFLFVHKKAIADVGLFDERYQLYFEDTDWCRMFWEKKWKVVYNTDAKIIHNHNRESAKVAWYKFFTNKTTRWHIASWIKYLKKWGF